MANNRVKGLLRRKGLQNQRINRWLVFSVIGACVLALLMTVLFIWHAVTYTHTGVSAECSPCQTGDQDEVSGQTLYPPPCPKLPTVLPLQNRPLPKELRDVFLQLNASLKKMVNESTLLPAISVNVFYHDSVIWSSHHGSRRFKDSNAKPDGDTVYRIGSVSKIFPVLLLYKLYQSGLISSIDDPLNKYVPKFSIKNPFNEDNITLREIASQMSGLPREAPCIYHCKDTNSVKELALLKNRSLVHAPWTLPSYSNLGYALLGRLLTEKLLNRSFERWVKQEILDPLGMKKTGFEISDKVERNMAFPYHSDGQRMPFSDIGWANPSGGMYSTVNDLAKLGMTFARPSKQSILIPSYLREMSLPIDIAPDGQTAWGSPFEMSLIKGFLVRGKSGRIETYNAYFSFVPQLELGINILISAVNHVSGEASSIAFAHEAYSRLLPALNETLFLELDRAEFPIDAKAFTGNYQVNKKNTVTLSKSRYKATIIASKGVLQVQSSSPNSFPFSISFIGETLTFRAKYLTPNPTCFNEQTGVFADMFFETLENDGFSHAFSIPQWGINGKRITE